MTLNWINPKKYSFNTFLLLDPFVILLLATNQHPKFHYHLGIALKYNPAVLWYFNQQCPLYEEHFNNLVDHAPEIQKKEDIRLSELDVIKLYESCIVYAYPEVMDQLTYITGWDDERLLSITNFENKKVLDLGSGTGRLAFAAAPYAKVVYACEPCERLRAYLKEKQKRLNIKNMYVLDGVIEAIPFEDDTFDIIMFGHVMGDHYEQEYQELCRVLKTGGYIIDCPGEDERKREMPSQEMLDLGFEYSHYTSKYNGDVYRYWKKVIKL